MTQRQLSTPTSVPRSAVAAQATQAEPSPVQTPPSTPHGAPAGASSVSSETPSPITTARTLIFTTTDSAAEASSVPGPQLLLQNSGSLESCSRVQLWKALEASVRQASHLQQQLKLCSTQRDEADERATDAMVRNSQLEAEAHALRQGSDTPPHARLDLTLGAELETAERAYRAGYTSGELQGVVDSQDKQSAMEAVVDEAKTAASHAWEVSVEMARRAEVAQKDTAR